MQEIKIHTYNLDKINHTDRTMMYYRTLLKAVLLDCFGTKLEKVFNDKNFSIYKKTIHFYTNKNRILVKKQLTYLVIYNRSSQKLDKEAFKAYIEYKPNEVITKSVEQKIKMAVCQKIFDVWGIKLSKK